MFMITASSLRRMKKDLQRPKESKMVLVLAIDDRLRDTTIPSDQRETLSLFQDRLLSGASGRLNVGLLLRQFYEAIEWFNPDGTRQDECQPGLDSSGVLDRVDIDESNLKELIKLVLTIQKQRRKVGVRRTWKPGRPRLKSTSEIFAKWVEIGRPSLTRQLLARAYFGVTFNNADAATKIQMVDRCRVAVQREQCRPILDETRQAALSNNDVLFVLDAILGCIKTRRRKWLEENPTRPPCIKEFA
jgi:hypothetical protein